MIKKLPSNSKLNISSIDFETLSTSIDSVVSKYFNIKLDFFYEVVLLPSKKMLNLNQKLRQKNYVADVITISFWEHKDAIENVESAFVSNLLGEIYLCPEQIKINAQNYGVSFLSEFSRMYIHGIMHLFDFDHESSKTIEYLTLEIQDKINQKVLKRYLKNEKHK